MGGHGPQGYRFEDASGVYVVWTEDENTDAEFGGEATLAAAWEAARDMGLASELTECDIVAIREGSCVVLHAGHGGGGLT